MDWTNVSVAAISVVGTLGGGVVTQIFAIRSKRIDALTQREQRAEDARELARKESTDEKRAIYAALNSAAHSARASARRLLADKTNGRNPDLEKFEEAWEVLRDNYARAQMVLSDRALAVASEVTRCLELGREAVLEVDIADSEAVRRLDHYVDDTLGFAVRLLRRGVREDLGLESEGEESIAERLRVLKETRRQQFGRGGGIGSSSGLPNH